MAPTVSAQETRGSPAPPQAAAAVPAVPPAAPANVPLLDGHEGRDLLLRYFRPKSRLKVEQHLLTRAKFPVVDVHSHFRVRFRESREQLEEYLRVMDRNRIAVSISLDGQWGDAVSAHQKYLAHAPDRFLVFANIDWMGDGQPTQPATWACHREDFVRHVGESLRDARLRGACGVKIFKQFGLEYRNPDGTLVKIDDPRWDGIWQVCGELRLPVLIHTADPEAFFLPIDETNERWEELHRRPEWSFPADRFPPQAELLAALRRVIARHPQTVFIAAHMAGNAEDLKTVGEWLDAHPNLYVEIASRISELGRQPYTARRFFLQYADRILFGTDGPWPEPRLSSYWRFLETYDEYFPYSEKEFPPQGFWNIYGIGLPDDVLKKVYHENAERLIPQVRSLREKFESAPNS